MAASTVGIKHKPLSLSEELNIISKANGSPNATGTNTAAELWNMELYTATIFEKRARQPTLDIWNDM
jgi:hypothetical protein